MDRPLLVVVDVDHGKGDEVVALAREVTRRHPWYSGVRGERCESESGLGVLLGGEEYEAFRGNGGAA